MKLWILSDLHLTARAVATATIDPAAMPQVDAAVIAGDVCDDAEQAIAFLGRTIGRRMPVIFTMGNHEFFGRDHASTRLAAALAADRTGVRLLDDG